MEILEGSKRGKLHLGWLVRELRLAKELTQAEMAGKLSCTRQWLSDTELDKVPTKRWLLVNLKEAIKRGEL